MATSTPANAEPHVSAGDRAQGTVASRSAPSECCLRLPVRRNRTAGQNTPPAARETPAETLVTNIVEIEGAPRFKAAYTEWIRQKEASKAKLDDGEKAKVDLWTQVYNIIGIFSVFQGVVLTAVSQLASQGKPQCGKVWVPIVLSVIAAVVSIFALWEKFVTIQNQRGKEWIIGLVYRTNERLVLELQKRGTNFSFRQEDIEEITRDISDSPQNNFWFKKIAVLVGLFILTAFFVVSYLVILCDKWIIRGWN